MEAAYGDGSGSRQDAGSEAVLESSEVDSDSALIFKTHEERLEEFPQLADGTVYLDHAGSSLHLYGQSIVGLMGSATCGFCFLISITSCTLVIVKDGFRMLYFCRRHPPLPLATGGSPGVAAVNSFRQSAQYWTSCREIRRGCS